MNDADLLPRVFAQYPLRVTAWEHLRTSENRVLRVDTAEGTRYALRLRRAGAAYLNSLTAELDYLHALKASTGLEVPTPVPTRTGERMVQFGEGPDQMVAVLFSWVPGRQVEAQLLTRPQMAQMAQATAALHRFARSYRPPADVRRPVYDADWYFGAGGWRSSPAFTDRLDPVARARLGEFTAGVARDVSALVRDENTFGLIHYDLHVGNFLFTDQAAHPIDFDELGFGFYLFDLAHLLFEFVEREEYPAFQQVLLETYRTAGGPAEAGGGELKLFLALQVVAYLNWLNRVLVRDGNTGAMDYWVPRLLQRVDRINRS